MHTLQKTYDAYGRYLRAKKVSATALREYRIVTGAWLAYCQVNQIDADDLMSIHVSEFFGQSGWSPSTQHARLTYVRSPLRYAEEELGLRVNQCRRVSLESVPENVPVTIPNGKLREMEHTPLWALLTYTGARSVELRHLTWNDVSFTDATIHIHGKGKKERTIPMHPEVARILKPVVHGEGSPLVFPNTTGGIMRPNVFWRKVHALTGFQYAPHDFRRTVASSLEDNDAREAAIYQILGWGKDKSVRLTNYTLISQRRLYQEILKLYADEPL